MLEFFGGEELAARERAAALARRGRRASAWRLRLQAPGAECRAALLPRRAGLRRSLASKGSISSCLLLDARNSGSAVSTFCCLRLLASVLHDASRHIFARARLCVFSRSR